DGRKYGDEYMAELDYIEVAEKAKEGYESDVSDLEEDDNVIDDMLHSDDNFSYSGNSAIGSRNEDDYDDDDYEDIGEEDDEVDDDDNADDHTFIFDVDSSSSSDGIDKDKNTDIQNRRERRISPEESLIVERESKASALSRLGTPMMCILALKRADNDLKKTSLFLKQHVTGGHTSAISSEGTCETVNGVSPQPVPEDNSGTKTAVQCNSNVDPVSSIEEKQNKIESVEDKKNSEAQVTDSEMDQEKANPKGDIVGSTKDDVPQLLSADDLQRLAASQPKSLQPPVLTRRGTVLDETIEKLKKRVVSPDVSLLKLHDNTENKQSSGEITNDICETSKDICTIDKKSSSHGDKDDSNDRSETSSPSRNSSSLSQSTSSRSSSPAITAIDLINRRKKDREEKILSEKVFPAENDSANGQISNVRYLKTRSLFGEEHCYVIDATFGNCGRFLNHSCSPNLFVQNVFIDTHDMRFPWVAFFAQNNIKAGSELTWDYMYEVGSVRDKSLYCLCGSSGCRGRLL
ncbi:histone-lysine N-methyltransferase SETDB1 isoform X3, partial [Paramuricea clavata]